MTTNIDSSITTKECRKWEDKLSYRNIWTGSNHRLKDKLANRFLSNALPPSLYRQDITRLRQINSTKSKLRYSKYKITPSYFKSQRRSRRIAKARRNLACWEDYTWVMSLADVDMVNGIILNYKEYLNKKTGYKQVQLDNCKTFFVHRLVMMKFLGDWIDSNMEVNHKDGDKTNNTIDNLELLSHADNLKHYSESQLARDRKAIRLARVWDILAYKESQPKGLKYINTMANFGIIYATLNSYGLVFSQGKIQTGKKEYYISEYLNRKSDIIDKKGGDNNEMS